jgi:hypothetical protein
MTEEKMNQLKKCSRCRSEILIKFFSMNRKGAYFKTCDNCRSIRTTKRKIANNIILEKDLKKSIKKKLEVIIMLKIISDRNNKNTVDIEDPDNIIDAEADGYGLLI